MMHLIHVCKRILVYCLFLTKLVQKREFYIINGVNEGLCSRNIHVMYHLLGYST